MLRRRLIGENSVAPLCNRDDGGDPRNDDDDCAKPSSVDRMGYGAMQLAGPHVFGEPKDSDEACTVLREALRLGVDRMPIVNLHRRGREDDVAAPMRVMRQMHEQGLLAHIGVSTVSPEQLRAAQDVAPVVCVQSHYNLVHRDDDAMIDGLAESGIA